MNNITSIFNQYMNYYTPQLSISFIIKLIVAYFIFTFIKDVGKGLLTAFLYTVVVSVTFFYIKSKSQIYFP